MNNASQNPLIDENFREKNAHILNKTASFDDDFDRELME